jgi:hypothetical protein
MPFDPLDADTFLAASRRKPAVAWLIVPLGVLPAIVWILFELQRVPYVTTGTLLGGPEILAVRTLMAMFAFVWLMCALRLVWVVVAFRCVRE